MKRLWYSLRMFFVAWRVYGDLHKLAATHLYVTTPAVATWLRDAAAKLVIGNPPFEGAPKGEGDA